ncbi:hypothetical protein PR048_003349 [Dryococelus australis]|uniref:Uncharacterized protein n=1 Tax=Dryococelus australis TaxID=614101 RepID=A0ABQ9IMU8_9NEOP|nr:hypothetical protein PR048_003349 [Dryococelus australis]
MSQSTSGSVHTNSKQEEYDTLLKELEVLERDQWPSEKPPGFGEIEIEHLCRRFKLTASKIKNGYHDYPEDSSRVSKELNLSFNCIKLIPCSSAECVIPYVCKTLWSYTASEILSHVPLAGYGNIGKLMIRGRAKHNQNKDSRMMNTIYQKIFCTLFVHF